MGDNLCWPLPYRVSVNQRGFLAASPVPNTMWGIQCSSCSNTIPFNSHKSCDRVSISLHQAPEHYDIQSPSSLLKPHGASYHPIGMICSVSSYSRCLSVLMPRATLQRRFNTASWDSSSLESPASKVAPHQVSRNSKSGAFPPFPIHKDDLLFLKCLYKQCGLG